jgi:hypothetical protein
MVPLELFCDGFVRTKEEDFVLYVQENFLTSCQVEDSVCGWAMNVPHIMFSS